MEEGQLTRNDGISNIEQGMLNEEIIRWPDPLLQSG